MSSISSIWKAFDKFAKVSLFTADGRSVVIDTPAYGPKPWIDITGNYITAGLVGQMDIRIKNFYPDIPLSDFTTIEIIVGYRGIRTAQDIASNTNTGDNTTIKGNVFYSYQETPGPDGITLFHVMTGSGFVEAANQPVNTGMFATDTATAQQAVSKMIGVYNSQVDPEFALTLVDNTKTPAFIEGSFQFSGSLKEGLAQLRAKLPNASKFNYYFHSNMLILWDFGGDTGVEYDIQYVTSPPQVGGAGLTFQAPWLPSLKMGDRTKISPEWKRGRYSGTVVTLPDVLVAFSIAFEFNTVEQKNMMTVVAFNSANPPEGTNQ